MRPFCFAWRHPQYWVCPASPAGVGLQARLRTNTSAACGDAVGVMAPVVWVGAAGQQKRSALMLLYPRSDSGYNHKAIRVKVWGKSGECLRMSSKPRQFPGDMCAGVIWPVHRPQDRRQKSSLFKDAQLLRIGPALALVALFRVRRFDYA